MNSNEVQLFAQSLGASIIETHISWVLLTTRHAYKIKKPVKTSFLNFSTLALRKKYCAKELILNQEYTKHIYLGINTIRKHDNLFTFKNEGQIADYAVVMKRLDGKKQMNYLLQENKITHTDILNLARIIANIHQKAPIKKLNKLNYLSDEFYDLFLVINKSDVFTKKQINQFKSDFKFIVRFLKDQKGKFIERQKEGMIREVHGDLHCGNIFLYRQPILFDRIEFSKNLRTIDLLHETALLCMDLEFHDREDLSHLFLESYLKKISGIPDFFLKEIFIFYKCYMANVRAKVNLISFQKSKNNDQHSYDQFVLYHKLMRQYLDELH